MLVPHWQHPVSLRHHPDTLRRPQTPPDTTERHPRLLETQYIRHYNGCFNWISVEGFDAGTPLTTSSVTQTPIRHPQTPPDTSRHQRKTPQTHQNSVYRTLQKVFFVVLSLFQSTFKCLIVVQQLMPLLRHILDTNKTLTRLLQTLDKIISIKVVQDFPLEIFYLFLLKLAICS